MALVSLPAVRGIDRTSYPFLRALVWMCRRVKVDPVNLLAVMSSETAGTFDPAIHPPKGGATGLIQFMPETARTLGTTTEKLARMSQVEQLVYVERFFQPHAKRNLAERRPVDTYLAVFAPSHIGEDMSSVVYAAPSKEYKANIKLDTGKDDKIQVSEVAAVIGGVLARAAKVGWVNVDVWPEGTGAALALVALAGTAAVAIAAERYGR